MPAPRSEQTGAQVAVEHELQVALLQLPPLFRRGLGAALADAGHDVQAPDDVERWARDVPGRRLVITTDEDAALQALERLQATAPQVLSVVLLARSALERYGRALPRCTGAVPIDVDVEDVLLAVDVASSGFTLLPVPVARELAERGDRSDAPPPDLTDRERTWLRELAAGATVARLARSAGYSEREMYRLLSSLYQQLGADTRTEALLRADRHGLLDQPPPASAAPNGAGRVDGARSGTGPLPRAPR